MSPDELVRLRAGDALERLTVDRRKSEAKRAARCLAALGPDRR
ncbi:MAG TPA: hypothetical protein VJL81_04565 [Solirubrobacterales bacterium]|nr:hypothetical protein [Solirubrobacterales bacterium]